MVAAVEDSREVGVEAAMGAVDLVEDMEALEEHQEAVVSEAAAVAMLLTRQ